MARKPPKSSEEKRAKWCAEDFKRRHRRSAERKASRLLNHADALKKDAASRARNRDALNERRRAYVAKYPERARLALKKFQMANRENLSIAAAKANAKRLVNPPDRIRYLASLAEHRCRKFGRFFERGFAASLAADPPDKCACCSSVLDYSRLNGKNRKECPSIDRVDNRLGYFAGNVQIICRHCNTRKNNMSLEQIEQIATYMRNHYGPDLREVA